MRIARFLMPVLTVLLLAPAAVRAVQYDVYIAAGQSNMDGRAPNSGLPTSPFNYTQAQNTIKLFYGGATANNTPVSTNGWVSLAPGYSVPPNYTSLPSSTFGPELSFGHDMAAAQPGRNIAIIKYSIGGTSLNTHWRPPNSGTPGPQYTGLLSTVSQALSILSSQGNTYTIKGMIWHQGEQDGVDGINTSTYETLLKNFISSVRGSLGIPNMPFIIGELYEGQSAFNQIRPAQLDASKTVPFAGFASAAGFGTIDNGQGHFDAPSQITLGSRFASAMQPFVVPEPTTLGVMSLAGLAMTIRRSRRSRRCVA